MTVNTDNINHSSIHYPLILFYPEDTSNQYPWQTNRTNSIVHSLKLLFNTTKPMSPIHTPPTPTIQTATSATTTSKPTPLLHQVATNANMAFKTISIPNISFNQVDYYLNKTNANINSKTTKNVII